VRKGERRDEKTGKKRNEEKKKNVRNEKRRKKRGLMEGIYIYSQKCEYKYQ
jgi:hypothetical protein